MLAPSSPLEPVSTGGVEALVVHVRLREPCGQPRCCGLEDLYEQLLLRTEVLEHRRPGNAAATSVGPGRPKGLPSRSIRRTKRITSGKSSNGTPAKSGAQKRSGCSARRTQASTPSTAIEFGYSIVMMPIGAPPPTPGRFTPQPKPKDHASADVDTPHTFSARPERFELPTF